VKRIKLAWRRFVYRLYLRTPHWKRIRERALKYADYKCLTCRSPNRLEVHHLRYRRNGKSILWHELMSDVAVLCHDCHAKEHGYG
jgi:5-methylcytosine-specific restriction endonuclease McrA